MAKLKPDLEAMVTDFQQHYGRTRLKSCLVCDSPNRELIEILMRGGAGGPSISKYLRERHAEQMGQSVLSRHKSEHLNADEDR